MLVRLLKSRKDLVPRLYNMYIQAKMATKQNYCYEPEEVAHVSCLKLTHFYWNES